MTVSHFPGYVKGGIELIIDSLFCSFGYLAEAALFRFREEKQLFDCCSEDMRNVHCELE